MASKHCSVPRCRESRKLLKSAKYEGAKAESIHCSKHACRTLEGYPKAVACSNIALPGAKYCDIHPSCTVMKCNYQRSPTKPFCHNHACAVGSCPNPASSNRRCEVHMSCPIRGCPRFLHKRPDGQGWYATCNIHVSKRCGFAGCPTNVGLTDTYCADHTCTVRGCPKQRVSDGSNCENHICTVRGCPKQRVSGSSNCENHICTVRGCPKQRVSDGSNCETHICAANKCPLPVAHPGQARPNHHMCTYCLVHECNTKGCHVAAVAARGHCPTHGCKVRGCNNAKSPDKSLDGYCFSHISEDMRRKAEQVGRNAEFNEAIRRREKEMDQRREREKIQRELDERMRLEEEIESLKRENQKLQAENASVADHYSDQHYHWDSAESPRSGSFCPDYPYDNFSYQQRTGGIHTDNIPRSQYYDEDSDTAVSTDDIPARSRPAAPYRYVFRKGRV